MVDINKPEEFRQLILSKFPEINEPELIDEIMQFGRVMSFHKDEILMKYNSFVRYVPLILEGQIKVMRKPDAEREILLYYISAGESCAMSFSCCKAHKRAAISTIAVAPTTIISLPIQKVDEWLIRFQSWKNFVIQNYDRKMLDILGVVDQIAFLGNEDRLLHYLDNRSKTLQSDKLTLTHQEIASDLNVSRESVSRMLKKMEKESKLSLERNLIIIHELPRSLSLETK